MTRGFEKIKQPAPDERDELLERYVEICNRALSANAGRFPFKQILGEARRTESGKNIEVQVLEHGRPAAASYVFTVEEGGIAAHPHSTCGACDCVRKWGVEKSYLREVVSDPDPYIRNPALIDWEWMFGAVA